MDLDDWTWADGTSGESGCRTCTMTTGTMGVRSSECEVRSPETPLRDPGMHRMTLAPGKGFPGYNAKVGARVESAGSGARHFDFTSF